GKRKLLLLDVRRTDQEAATTLDDRFQEDLPDAHPDNQERGVLILIQLENLAKDQTENDRHGQGPDQRPANAQGGVAVTVAQIGQEKIGPEVAEPPDPLEIVDTHQVEFPPCSLNLRRGRAQPFNRWEETKRWQTLQRLSFTTSCSEKVEEL